MDEKDFEKLESILNEDLGEESSLDSLFKTPKDVELIEEILSYLYTQFKMADGKTKMRVLKHIISILDLKWKYLGLERIESKIDLNKLKEALKKAGVASPEEALIKYLEGGTKKDGQEEEFEEDGSSEEGDEASWDT